MKTYILYYRIILALALVFFLFIAFRMWRGKAGRVFRAILDVEKARNYDEEKVMRLFAITSLVFAVLILLAMIFAQSVAMPIVTIILAAVTGALSALHLDRRCRKKRKRTQTVNMEVKSAAETMPEPAKKAEAGLSEPTADQAKNQTQEKPSQKPSGAAVKKTEPEPGNEEPEKADAMPKPAEESAKPAAVGTAAVKKPAAPGSAAPKPAATGPAGITPVKLTAPQPGAQKSAAGTAPVKLTAPKQPVPKSEAAAPAAQKTETPKAAGPKTAPVETKDTK